MNVDESELRELVEAWDEERTDVMEGEQATERGQAHRAGVACGMDYCITQLQRMVDK